ncbi:MAG: hypothetical protein KJ749_06390 [Planctomycetes bacterium]|nr:hypothetical protein [Planctomycetota bacterium]
MMRVCQGLVLAAALCFGSVVVGSEGIEERAAADTLAALRSQFDGVSAYQEGTRVRSVFGRTMTTGPTAVSAADRFREIAAAAFGVGVDDLQPGMFMASDRRTQPLMYDQETGQYKFTLVYYSQFKNGIPVFRSDLRVLVRNVADHPVVQANSSLHELGGFAVDMARAVVREDLARAAARSVVSDLTNFTEPQTVVWAGVDNMVVEPTLAVTFVGDNGKADAGDYHKRLFVADAATGVILYDEDLIIKADVEGRVSGMATEPSGADYCGRELVTRMPYAYVSVVDGNSAYADAGGDFVIAHGGTQQVTVESPVRGLYFRVYNNAGTDTVIPLDVVPPGPAMFVHNQTNVEEYKRAEVNGYVQANVVRDFALTYNPSYPVIATQTNFTVRVNRDDVYCPGNAWWDGSSLNFCRAEGSYPNTAFASVVHHEYGHHLVNAGGSGQDQYGEGMSDCVAVLIADDPVLGYGFSGNCSSGLRTADNNFQYPCSGEAHTCANLLSGCVWSTRNELAASHPEDYLEILSSLTINSIPMHSGSMTTPQITIDFLTLDDDDSNLENGTPHWSEICTGFGAHNMDCPALVLINFEYPDGLPELVSPGVETAIRVNVVPNVVAPVPGTGTVSYVVGEGSFITVPMTELSPDEYEAVLPAAPCGETMGFYFGAEADVSGGTLMTDPIDSPSSYFSAFVATSVLPVVAYDFESTTGWTVSGDAADGQWGAGIPVNGDRGDPPSDYDGSGRCYVTDNVDGNSDVDNGTTILTSPTFDLSGLEDPWVSYARWYSNVEGDSPLADTFYVRVSDDNGASWSVLETVGPGGEEVYGGWYVSMFSIADTVEVTAQFRIRFEASDLGSGSVVEAGVDAFEIFDLACAVEPPMAPPAPFDARKNRYVSFAPQNLGKSVAFQVEVAASALFPGVTGVVGWVDEPTELVPGEGIAGIADSPVYRVWPETVIHLGGCAIVPGTTYQLRASTTPEEFSGPFQVATVAMPAPNVWGDVAGAIGGDEWSAPNGVVNFDDVTAAIQFFLSATTAPHLTWVDLEPQGPNAILNFSDIMQIVLAFQGGDYPFADPLSCP